MNEDEPSPVNAAVPPPAPTNQPPPGPIPPILAGPAPKPAASNPLKIAIPIIVLMAVIFGVTFFSQYTPRSVEDDSSGGAGKNSSGGEPPLRFFTGIRQWKPFDEPYTLDRMFTGAYEPGDSLHSAQFMFENRHPKSVTLSIIGTACQGARVAAIPPDVTDQLAVTSILSGLPCGFISPLPLAFAAVSANLAPDRLQWQESFFTENRPYDYRVPPAPESPRLMPAQWGIFELIFKVPSTTPPRFLLKTQVSLKTEGDSVESPSTFEIYYDGVDPFEVVPKSIEVGELTADSEARTFSFLVYSSSRGPKHTEPGNSGDLAPPHLSGALPPFIVVDEPVRISEAVLDRVYDRNYFKDRSPILSELRDISLAQKRPPVRIDSAYRYTVTVKARDGDRLADVGVLERDIALALPHCPTKLVHLKGLVRGPVWLDNKRADIDLPSYRSDDGIVHTVRLTTERREAELVLLPAECSPKFATYQLTKLPPASDFGYYELKVSIPSNTPTGSWNGTIVLELRGPKPQRVRIPIHAVVKL